MPEMPDAGEHHRQAQPVRGLDHFVVAHRSAGLDHRGRAMFAGSSTPSGNGKKASDPTTVPWSGSTAFIAPILTESTRLIWPAPTPTVCPAARIDDGVRLHVLGDFPGELERGPFFARWARAGLTTRHRRASKRCASAVCARYPPVDALHDQRLIDGCDLQAGAGFSSPAGLSSACGE